jgi:hypothetical protein
MPSRYVVPAVRVLRPVRLKVGVVFAEKALKVALPLLFHSKFDGVVAAPLTW